MTAQPPELKVVADPAAALAVVLADQAARGGSIVLTGGASVAEAYERAAALEPDWGRVTLWWGDERCVPPDDERSNYRLAKEALLDRIETPPAEVHRIRGEIEPAAAADELDAALAGVKLDLLLLGLGSDGHMASLFAGSPQLEVLDRRATWGPAGLEPFVDREEKAEAVARVFGSVPSHEIPASLARLGEVDIKVFLDPAAASKLDGR